MASLLALLRREEKGDASPTAAYVLLAALATVSGTGTTFVDEGLVERLAETLQQVGRRPVQQLVLAATALANLTSYVPSPVAAKMVQGNASAVKSLLNLLAESILQEEVARTEQSSAQGKRRGRGKGSKKDTMDTSGAIKFGQWAAASLCNLSQQGREAARAIAAADGVNAIVSALERGQKLQQQQQQQQGGDVLRLLLLGCLCNLAKHAPASVCSTGSDLNLLDKDQLRCCLSRASL